MADDVLKGLFLAHRRELQAYLTRKLRDADTAADLTQETFLRYAELASPAGGAISNERSYLYRTAHNLAIDHVRQSQRRKTDATRDDDMADIADDRPTLEDEADARLRLERLHLLIGELPELTRKIFILNRIDGLTYSQVAAHLGISDSSVQKHLSKALLHITTRLRKSAAK
ncbi:sigma-70 family RNA polymerase sigma factor [Rhizobium lusitanum]|uniref:Sigma-70 family RNA polymerase sigma factor n=1 Tax=Rhizobium lusitanum TaxID=293958 RepID=A0A6L9UFW5_9HYPH|nr:RNA polymerase sigma factor [Rhizobium lusitanum]NEI74524.1 sigma-70 family RNA polymerase sigma factor [Rhizobium lusitanum]